MFVFRYLILYFVEILALKAVTLWQQIDCLNENYTLKMLIYHDDGTPHWQCNVHIKLLTKSLLPILQK